MAGLIIPFLQIVVVIAHGLIESKRQGFKYKFSDSKSSALFPVLPGWCYFGSGFFMASSGVPNLNCLLISGITVG